MKKVLSIVIGAVLTATLFAGCSQTGTDFGTSSSQSSSKAALSGKITMSGSTSMEELVNALGEAFSKENTGVKVEVQGGGSGVGVTNAKDGISDIGNASRALKDSEKSLGLTETVICYDGIAIVVNPTNTVADLTKEQIAKIFTGEIKNWKEVGGPDATILVVGREAGSGTRDGFEEIVGVKEKCKYSVEVNETGIVKTKVGSEKYAIGYMSLGKVDSSVKALKVGGITPSEKTVLDKTYIIQRPFTCLTKTGSETELVKAFYTYILSDAGQAVVTKSGFVKLAK